MEDQIWFKSYPEGVPKEVDVKTYHSLNDMFDQCIEKYRDKPAYESFGKIITYEELDEITNNFVAFLQGKGLKKGDRIAIQLPNILQYPIAMFAALKAGLIIVNINPLFTSPEMLEKFEDSQCKAIVIVENFAYKLEKIIDKTSIETVIVTGIGDMVGGFKGPFINFLLKYVKKSVKPYPKKKYIPFSEALKEGVTKQVTPVKINKEDMAFLQYTGGTTGVPKGAVIKHKNIIAQVEQNGAWMGQFLEEKQEVILTPLPLYHIFSLTVNCFTFFSKGAKNILIANPRDIPALVKVIKNGKISVITAVNTLFNALLHNEKFRKIDFSNLKIIVGGGMAVQRSVAEEWKRVTGVPLCEGYGLTEASPVISCNPFDGTDKIGSIGLPFSNTLIKIADDEGHEGYEYKTGEVLVKGPQVMDAYWNKPEETELAFQDGWLKTGDIGYIDDDGFIYIVDRKKDLINVSGFNVYPNEIEEVAVTHPKVLEVGVKGYQDDEGFEHVEMYIVKKDDSLTEQEIKDHCKLSLTKYKIPKRIHFRDELPKTNVGKILRKDLK